jgi:thymidylate synthase (FAD)
VAIQVKLLDYTHDPIRSLYLAYRTAYSALTPVQINKRIDDGRISRDEMASFVERRLQTGHASPLEQVWFEFGISGVSRTFSHQFVRHRVGISFEQQSQRYVKFKDAKFPYTVPESVSRAGLGDRMETAFQEIGRLYQDLIDAGVPAEDARFVLPNATSTNFKVTVNFQELLHICDLRLCTRAQWEFRKVAALMRAEVNRNVSELGHYLQPKCGEKRWGYCDEDYEAWEVCPIGRKRPHKRDMFQFYDSYRKGELIPLDERDFKLIEREETGVP